MFSMSHGSGVGWLFCLWRCSLYFIRCSRLWGCTLFRALAAGWCIILSLRLLTAGCEWLHCLVANRRLRMASHFVSRLSVCTFYLTLADGFVQGANPNPRPRL